MINSLSAIPMQTYIVRVENESSHSHVKLDPTSLKYFSLELGVKNYMQIKKSISIDKTRSHDFQLLTPNAFYLFSFENNTKNFLEM